MPTSLVSECRLVLTACLRSFGRSRGPRRHLKPISALTLWTQDIREPKVIAISHVLETATQCDYLWVLENAMSHSWLSSKDWFKPAEARPCPAFSERKYSITQLHAMQAQQVLIICVLESCRHNLQPSSRASSKVAMIFPTASPMVPSPLHPPPPPHPPTPLREPLRFLESMEQLLSMLGSSKPVSNPSLLRTTHTSPAQLSSLAQDLPPDFPAEGGLQGQL